MNRGFRQMFAPGQLTLGLWFPIEAYTGSIPTMALQKERAQQAEVLGFAALWFRDVPLHDPSFGDVGQIYDPWVYLGFIAAQTQQIALATGSVILPFRHPLHTAKAAASVDQLSQGRLVLGVASGDRPIEFPAFGVEFERRGECFREALTFIRQAWQESSPKISSPLGQVQGADPIPKPYEARIPILVTGHSQQSLAWIATHGDGWLMYPRHPQLQTFVVEDWRSLTESIGFKPFAQSLYIDLTEDPKTPATPIHLGYRLGREALIDLLRTLQDLGVNHVGFNLKYGQRSAAEVLEEMGQEIVPLFPSISTSSLCSGSDLC